jgi:hypothetical protein
VDFRVVEIAETAEGGLYAEVAFLEGGREVHREDFIWDRASSLGGILRERVELDEWGRATGRKVAPVLSDAEVQERVEDLVVKKVAWFMRRIPRDGLRTGAGVLPPAQRPPRDRSEDPGVLAACEALVGPIQEEDRVVLAEDRRRVRMVAKAREDAEAREGAEGEGSVSGSG